MLEIEPEQHSREGGDADVEDGRRRSREADTSAASPCMRIAMGTEKMNENNLDKTGIKEREGDSCLGIPFFVTEFPLDGWCVKPNSVLFF